MTNSRLTESWTWYGFASLAVVLRYISRCIRLGGPKNLELEDIMMVPLFAFYTNFVVFVNIQTNHPMTNILPPTGTAGMTEAEINDRIYGSKVTFVLEESMIMIQFLTKVCMSLMFLKITAGLQKSTLVKIVFGYCIMGWVITEIFYFGVWCRPFHDYFRVFDDNNPNCTTAQHHLIMSYCFNVSGDLALLILPIMILVQTQMPLQRKLVITGVFSFGIFVIIAGTLSRYYTFAQPDSILWIFWYVREASTCVIVANIPHLYALLRWVFKLEAFGHIFSRSGSALRSRFRSGRTGGAGGGTSGTLEAGNHSSNSKSGNHNNSNSSGNRSGKSHGGTGISLSDSTENFVSVAVAGAGERDSRSEMHPMQIWQRKEYAVDSVDAVEAGWDLHDARAVGGHSIP